MFISGQMWNQIRGPPLVHRNAQTGQVVSKINYMQQKSKVFYISLSFKHYVFRANLKLFLIIK